MALAQARQCSSLTVRTAPSRPSGALPSLPLCRTHRRRLMAQSIKVWLLTVLLLAAAFTQPISITVRLIYLIVHFTLSLQPELSPIQVFPRDLLRLESRTSAGPST